MRAVAHSTERTAGWLMVGIAIAAQWSWALLSPTVPVSDFQRYFEVASEYAATGSLTHHGRPFLFQPPAYPFALGCLFRLTGPSVVAGKLLNAALTSAAVVMLWLSLRRFVRPGWPGVLAFAPVALCPLWIGYIGVLGTECLSAFLVVATLWALGSLPGPWNVLASGIALGALVLNRPQFQLLIPAMLAWSLWARRDQFRRLCAWSLVAVLVVAPWTLRNWHVTGSFVTVAGYSGYVLLVNSNSANHATGWMPLSDIPLSDAERARFDAVGAGDLFEPGDEDAKTFRWTPRIDAVARSVAASWILADPVEFVRRAGRRMWKTYGDSIELRWWVTHGNEWPLPILEYRSWLGWIAFGLALVGMLRLSRRDAPPALVLAAATYGIGIATTVVFEGQGRYVLPTWPLVAPLALAALGAVPPQRLGAAPPVARANSRRATEAPPLGEPDPTRSR